MYLISLGGAEDRN